MSSEERFGFEWNKYSELDPNYELQFARWVYPLTQADFSGRRVLDAGCGMGRNSFWALKWGASKVTAFDFDRRSVSHAEKNLSEFTNAEVLFKSIYDIDWQNEFDVVFSIGVIHHLKNPRLAVSNLVRAAKPGATILLWVYSHEGSEWIVKYINPIRKNITSKLPVGLTHVLAYFFSVPLWFFVKIFRSPSPYLKQLSGFKFRHIHSIVFDQLIPEVANYWTKDEARDLFGGLGVENLQVIRPPTECGWTVTAKKLGG
jgi:SAM-dependent methyltransferase